MTRIDLYSVRHGYVEPTRTAYTVADCILSHDPYIGAHIWFWERLSKEEAAERLRALGFEVIVK